MNEQGSIEGPPARYRMAATLGALLVSFVLAGVFASGAIADAPAPPDFYWPYGKALLNGANLAPAEQPVIAFVNGQACGDGMTLVAEAAEGTPADDVGRTVYVLDVLADGTAPGQRPGCGQTNDPVTLYFPTSGRIATQQPAFKQGGERVDLELGVNLQYHQFAGVMRD